MQATTASELSARRELSSDKAARIVEAMRASVAIRGIAGSTFDHVAREAGVSRGLLHYYFGTKERLLLEVVRRECDHRIELLEQALEPTKSADDVIAALVSSLEDFLEDRSNGAVMFYEMLTLAQRNDEIAAELSELGLRTRTHLAEALRAKHDAGVLALRGDPDAISAFLFALADGVTIRQLTEPTFDIRPMIGHAVDATRALLA